MLCSNMSERDWDAYTSGDCFLLAKKLSDLGAGELAVVRRAEDKNCWSHMAVKIGGDTYLDVTGLSSSRELIEEYSLRHVLEVALISDAEYDELIEGQLPGIDSPERLHSIALELMDWAFTLDSNGEGHEAN